MFDNIKFVFLAGLVAYYVLFTAHRWRNRQSRIREVRLTGIESLLMILAFTGDTVMPLLYVFTPWLSFADYRLPAWLGWLGAPVFAGALWLFQRAHADLY